MLLPPTPVPNLYRADLLTTAPEVIRNGESMVEAVESLIRIMDGGAWTSTAADEYYSALTGHKRPCEASGTEASADMTGKAASEPPLVNPQNPAEAWKATWLSI